MSRESLEHLRDYIQLTLSPSDILWLTDELMACFPKPDQLKPYTMEEINAMIDQSERDIAEGRVRDFDEVMRELEEEFAESGNIQVAEEL